MKKLIVLVAFILSAPLVSAQISDLERNALIDLYKSTNGNEWNSSWNINDDASTWFGVTVKNNKVVELNLSMNNLNGTIPSSIKNLTSLKVLNLGFNKINGTIPSEITLIKSLESIQLFMNQIDSGAPGLPILPDRKGHCIVDKYAEWASCPG